ncbi:hypothetical protein AB0873_03025 [Micromonospora sp. NPDC047707]|uniref:hypothetical protein n=1 Tax=Micromonospora sp. NPDC047707 TaxID=3154498 RepID=UPI003453ECB3
MDDVPEDLAKAVHRAARTTPSRTSDLAAVLRRARARRRRRSATTAGGLALLVALTSGAVPLLARSPSASTSGPAGTTSRPTMTATPSPPARWPEPAQRLMVTVDRDSPPGVVEEVLPGGSIRRHRVPEDFSLGAALPDGRLVGLVYTDLTPGVARSDGPDVEGLSIRLVVLGPDGVERSREVRVEGQGIELLGADTTVAYLARDAGIVTHDLLTGREKSLLRSSTAGVDLLAASQTDVRPDRLVEQRDDHGCHTDVRRTTDGKRIARLTVSGLCVNGLRLSPDGALVAVPYRPLDTSGDRREQRLAVFDTATGALRADQLIADPAFVPGPITGVAWADDATVRVAWAGLPVHLGRDASVDDLVRKVATVRVQ